MASLRLRADSDMLQARFCPYQVLIWLACFVATRQLDPATSPLCTQPPIPDPEFLFEAVMDVPSTRA